MFFLTALLTVNIDLLSDGAFYFVWTASLLRFQFLAAFLVTTPAKSVMQNTTIFFVLMYYIQLIKYSSVQTF